MYTPDSARMPRTPMRTVSGAPGGGAASTGALVAVGAAAPAAGAGRLPPASFAAACGCADPDGAAGAGPHPATSQRASTRTPPAGLINDAVAISPPPCRIRRDPGSCARFPTAEASLQGPDHGPG